MLFFYWGGVPARKISLVEIHGMDIEMRLVVLIANDIR